LGLIKLALESVADIADHPVSGYYGLGSEGRMNYPGTIQGNWEWRFNWNQIERQSAKPLIRTDRTVRKMQT